MDGYDVKNYARSYGPIFFPIIAMTLVFFFAYFKEKKEDDGTNKYTTFEALLNSLASSVFIYFLFAMSFYLYKIRKNEG